MHRQTYISLFRVCRSQRIIKIRRNEWMASDGDMFIDRDQRISNIWKSSPIQPYHLRCGPQSAFARLFPERYRREQETVSKQRSLSNDHLHPDLPSIVSHCFSDDDDLKNCNGKRTRSRVTFSTVVKEKYTVLAKSESHLAETPKQKTDYYEPFSSYPDIECLRPKLIYQAGPYRLLCIPRVDARYLRPMVLSSLALLPRTLSSAPSEYRLKAMSKESLASIRSAPRRVVNRRLPPLPTRPRSVIFEKWLSYKAKAKQMGSLPLTHTATAESHYDVPRVYDDDVNPWLYILCERRLRFAWHTIIVA